MRGHRARAGKLDRRDLSRAQRLALTYSEVTKATARPGRDRAIRLGHRGPLPRGTDRAELPDAFPGCQITDHGPTGFHALPPIQLLMRPNEHWYRIRLG
jgi:hypothetical protein